jgi:hypothetical protein
MLFECTLEIFTIFHCKFFVDRDLFVALTQNDLLE